MKLIFAIISVLLLSQSLLAGHTVYVRTIERDCRNGSCTKIIGSGSAVILSRSKTGVWAASTAKHVVHGLRPEQVFVGLTGGMVPVRSIYEIEGDEDAAFITFETDEKLEPSQTVEDEIPAGEEIMFSGYSEGRKFERVTGKIVSTGFATAEVCPKQGQSGGGVYRKSDGRLIGILSGYDDQRRLVYVPVCRIQRQCVRQWGFWWGLNLGMPPQQWPTAPPPPIEVAPPYVPPMVTSRPPAVSQSNTEEIVQRVLARIPRPQCPPGELGPAGPPGPRGANGLQGLQGPAGRNGRDADPAELSAMRSELAALRAEVQAMRNVKIPVQILTKDGDILDSAAYRLGDPIKLKLAPK